MPEKSLAINQIWVLQNIYHLRDWREIRNNKEGKANFALVLSLFGLLDNSGRLCFIPHIFSMTITSAFAGDLCTEYSPSIDFKTEKNRFPMNEYFYGSEPFQRKFNLDVSRCEFLVLRVVKFLLLSERTSCSNMLVVFCWSLPRLSLFWNQWIPRRCDNWAEKRENSRKKHREDVLPSPFFPSVRSSPIIQITRFQFALVLVAFFAWTMRASSLYRSKHSFLLRAGRHSVIWSHLDAPNAAG